MGLEGKREDWIKYYKEMKRIRMVEEAISDNYYNEVREMRTPIHLSDGQEAVAVGICTALGKTDVIFSNHRCHGHYLAKGGSLNKMIAELHTRETGCCKGRGGSMHLMDKDAGISISSSIVAGNVSIGTGYALASKICGRNDVAVVFFGDGASEEGSVYESICFAELKKLPVIFVCENNLYSISTAFDKREPCKNVGLKFKNILPTYEVDGNDVMEVADLSNRLAEKVRNGEGPCFIECRTYRLRDHHNIGMGIDSGYRSREEWEAWQQKSPILRMEKFLKEEGLINSVKITEIETEIKGEIEKAFKFARDSNHPDPKELMCGLWG